MNDLDKMALELSKSFRSVALPPKLRYKVKKWLKSISAQAPDKQMDRRRVMQTAKSELTEALLRHINVKPLAKNELMASKYDNGAIRFDFGAEVPDNIKRAAMSWAKKRGLNPVEASMQKNTDHNSEYVIFGSMPTELDLNQEMIRLTV